MTNLAAFLALVDEAAQSQSVAEADPMDRWLLSRLQMRVEQVTSALENMLTRAACDEAFYKMWSDWRWYNRRKSGLGFSSAA
ncbi:MAG: class I tRNA ligase family protein, partial [Anaerolineae bacterium]|nr:class I tRNA ligase family protein [Anaerolineae bacterium]NIN99291.1 class I tRNA ligase family protein [Anaerolineae bacterium]NIQ82156.1 class I tRNA ligase family protein [Anaerolineae bacterium]